MSDTTSKSTMLSSEAYNDFRQAFDEVLPKYVGEKNRWYNRKKMTYELSNKLNDIGYGSGFRVKVSPHKDDPQKLVGSITFTVQVEFELSTT